MTQPAFDNFVLVLTVGCTALGGVVLAALLVQSWRSYALSAFFGLIAGIMLEPVLEPLWVKPFYFYGLTSDLLGAAVGLLARFIAELFLEKLLAELRTGALVTLVPERWSDPQGLAAVTTRDHVKRWFVTIAAATGAAVGSVLGIEEFWTALFHSLDDHRAIVFAVLLVGVSMFLTGPIQAFVFDLGARAKQPGDPAKKLSDLFADGFDWRAAGRFGLVLMAYVQLYLLTSCIGATIKQGSSRVVYTIFTAATVPAIVSYYWSAALQRRVPSVRDKTMEPSLYVGAIMSYGIALVIVVNFAMGEIAVAGDASDKRSAGLLFFFSPVIAILPALLLGALTTLAYSIAGGTAIDRFSGRYAMFGIAAALLIAAIAQQAVFVPLAWLLGFKIENIRFATFIGGIFGWMVGLWASGFPRLLTTDRPKEHSAELASRGPGGQP